MAHREPRDIWVWAFGEKKRLHEWVDDPRCTVSYATLYWRIVRHQWEPQTAITTPRKWHCYEAGARDRSRVVSHLLRQPVVHAFLASMAWRTATWLLGMAFLVIEVGSIVVTWAVAALSAHMRRHAQREPDQTRQQILEKAHKYTIGSGSG